MNELALEPLETVQQHRAVVLPEDVIADLDDQIRSHSQNVPVERGVVKLAEREAIGDHRLAERVAIREDVVLPLNRPGATP